MLEVTFMASGIACWRKRRRPSRFEAGFSLLELIVVLGLLTIITASVVPVFSGALTSVRKQHHIRDMLAVMHYAQNRAVLDTLEYRLYMDIDVNAYWLERYAGEEEGEAVFTELLERETSRHTLPEGLVMLKPDAHEAGKSLFYLGFYPSGACDWGVIVVEDEREGTVLRIESTGRREGFTWSEDRR
jgi:prepilin-type N-terminal cleavage/methylation domain-containing protein